MTHHGTVPLKIPMSIMLAMRGNFAHCPGMGITGISYTSHAVSVLDMDKGGPGASALHSVETQTCTLAGWTAIFMGHSISICVCHLKLGLGRG